MDKEKIHSKQLRQLMNEDLERYAFKAMTTWGDVEGFKYFLPRILELLSTSELLIDSFIILGKLKIGNWQTWNENEQKAIKNFLLEWWSDIIKNKSYIDIEAFVEIYKLLKNINPLLEMWNFSYEDNSFNNLIYLLQYYSDDLIDNGDWFKEIDKESMNKLNFWILSKKQIIEIVLNNSNKFDEETKQKIINLIYMLKIKKFFLKVYLPMGYNPLDSYYLLNPSPPTHSPYFRQNQQQ